ncbi:MAG: MotA/TolQ/ExbB proton channel family protein [Pseudomonadota bacterium]
MYQLVEWIQATRDFMLTGGWVLTLLAWVAFLMWVLIFERFIYFRTAHRTAVKNTLSAWENRSERKSWEAHRIREAMVSRVRMSAEGSLPIIKALVALCPLLGLLGTVSGMIEVFQVMAVSGTGNARSMAGGVSKATIPTMAGMVVALSGLFASTYLTSKTDREVELLQDNLYG